MERLFFFDTETTGVNPNTARMVSIAWMEISSNMEMISAGYQILLPMEREQMEADMFNQKPQLVSVHIPEEATDIHGITNEFMERHGRYAEIFMPPVIERLNMADKVIGHNVNYDIQILKTDIKHWIEPGDMAINPKDTVCTMRESTQYAKIPNKGRKGYKWPKLEELHNKLFGSGFPQAHNAFFDVRATVKCYFELRSRGVIQ